MITDCTWNLRPVFDTSGHIHTRIQLYFGIYVTDPSTFGLFSQRAGMLSTASV